MAGTADSSFVEIRDKSGIRISKYLSNAIKISTDANFGVKKLKIWPHLHETVKYPQLKIWRSQKGHLEDWTYRFTDDSEKIMAGVASAEFTNRRYWGTEGVGKRSKNFSSRKWKVDRKPVKFLERRKWGDRRMRSSVQ